MSVALMDLVREVLDEKLLGGSRTKIVCTLGPKSRSVPVLEALLQAGMSVARFNFSHGSHEYHQETLNNLLTAQKNTKLMCATLLDTKGPEIRTGTLRDGEPIRLEAGQKVVLSTAYSSPGGLLADGTAIVKLSYPMLARDVSPGCHILIADGSIVLQVDACNIEEAAVMCTCLNSNTLGERKNCNLPGVIVDLPTITDKDRVDIIDWGVANRVDFIAASFVRKGSDVRTIRSLVDVYPTGRDIKIVSKVENQEGLANFDDILAESDGVMVARGDLGMEIPTSKIFLAQKLMIHKCNLVGKPVITATQMLESMCKNPKPTRAEATDIANAVIDGTDCVMLSGETAAGSYPVEAVKIMGQICKQAEARIDYSAAFRAILNATPKPLSPLESLASSAVRTASKVHASLIIVLTRGGSTARLVAKYKPTAPVLAVAVPVLTTDNLSWTCSSAAPARQTLITRGLLPLLAEGSAKSNEDDTTDDILNASIEFAMSAGYCNSGETVVAMHRFGDASVMKIIDID